MGRHLVCLTFDFDAMSGFVARGMTTPTPISRGEFGRVGAGRILDLLQRRGIAATFFIPGTVIGTYPAICERMAAAGHEIGNHGWSHAVPATLAPDKEEADLVRANAAIRQLTGRDPAGYRSPSWDLSPCTIPLLLKHGFLYDSSMMGDDYQPYQARTGDRIELDAPFHFGAETALIEMPISWSLDDYPHFEFVRTATTILPGLANADAVLGNWREEFAYMRRSCDWGVLTYTFHPYVIGRGHRMAALERLVDFLAAEGATFVTMEQAAREYADRRTRTE